MKFKKFVIIPILLFAYLYFVDIIVSYNPMIGSSSEKTGSGGAEIIGVSEGVTVSVTRPYFFGLIRLPIYSSALGDISGIHNFFFNFILVLTVAFVLFEIIQWRRGKWTKKWKKY